MTQTKKPQFVSVEEAHRILTTIPDVQDMEKLSWYVGWLEGQVYR